MQSAYLCVMFHIEHKKLSFLAVLSWFLILDKSKMAVKMATIVGDVKIVLKYCIHPPPVPQWGVWICVYVRGLKQLLDSTLLIWRRVLFALINDTHLVRKSFRIIVSLVSNCDCLKNVFGTYLGTSVVGSGPNSVAWGSGFPYGPIKLSVPCNFPPSAETLVKGTVCWNKNFKKILINE